MYLAALRLTNFRSCRDVEVKLQRGLTLLVGDNNSGKSNVVDAVRLLTGPLSGRRVRYRVPAKSWWRERRLVCVDAPGSWMEGGMTVSEDHQGCRSLDRLKKDHARAVIIADRPGIRHTAPPVR
jgi:recombinational DNA repair ATPase RecF